MEMREQIVSWLRRRRERVRRIEEEASTLTRELGPDAQGASGPSLNATTSC